MPCIPTELQVLEDHEAEATLLLTGSAAPHFMQFMLDHCPGQRHNIGRILAGCLHRYRQSRYLQHRHKTEPLICLPAALQDEGEEAVASTPHPQPHGDNRVLVLSYRGGTGPAFRDALLRGPEFRATREAMRNAGQAEVAPGRGAVILIPPTYYASVSQALSRIQLHRHQVIVMASEAHMLEEVLSQIPARQRPYENKKAREIFQVQAWG